MRAKLPMLTGYRVLDITQFVAGPTCTRILAELGRGHQGGAGAKW